MPDIGSCDHMREEYGCWGVQHDEKVNYMGVDLGSLKRALVVLNFLTTNY